jgi:hypothetical protein
VLTAHSRLFESEFSLCALISAHMLTAHLSLEFTVHSVLFFAPAPLRHLSATRPYAKNLLLVFIHTPAASITHANDVWDGTFSIPSLTTNPYKNLLTALVVRVEEVLVVLLGAEASEGDEDKDGDEEEGDDEAGVINTKDLRISRSGGAKGGRVRAMFRPALPSFLGDWIVC